MSEHRQSGINRAFSWLKKTLQITEKTVAPDVLLSGVAPMIDVFGWERLGGVQGYAEATAAAPANSIAGPITPVDTLRLYLNASVRHTDTGVSHQVFLEKIVPGATQFIGLKSSGLAEIPVGVLFGIDRWMWSEPGSGIRVQTSINLVVGSIAIDLNFIDLPIGEYIP